MTTIRSDIQKQAQSALIQYAIFRWESAVVVALTIILTVLFPKPFAWWPWFGWLILGATGLGAIIYTSLTDAKTNADVLLKLFQSQFDVKQIRDRELRAEVEEALEYQRRIEMQVREQREGVMRGRLEDTANQTTNWISYIFELALRVDGYRADELLARERESLPREIESLTAQRQRERNPAVQAKLDEVISSKGKHWQAIRALDARMQQAALQLDQSTTALATVYSQVQLIDAQGVNSGGAERLQADIREQVARLDDLVASINEVYDYSKGGIG